MIFDTIYRRERRVSSRSCRMALVIALFNTAMAVMVLTAMMFAIETARVTAAIDYGAFYRIFTVMAMTEFVFMMAMAPAFSAGAVSTEAERGTLDMMLTTRLTAADIVIGKLLWSLSSAMLVVVSSLPILAILFVYGYVRIYNIVIMLLILLVMEIYIGGIGIWASAASARTPVAMAIAYGAVLLLTCGLPLLCTAVSNITGTPGALEGLLCLDPVVPFAVFLGSAARGGGMMEPLYRMLGFSREADIDGIARTAVLVQLSVGLLCTYMAVRSISRRS